jgi:hypothetical protein
MAPITLVLIFISVTLSALAQWSFKVQRRAEEIARRLRMPFELRD